MYRFENVSAKLFAAVGSMALSLVFFATAVVPANQGALLPAMMA